MKLKFSIYVFLSYINKLLTILSRLSELCNVGECNISGSGALYLKFEMCSKVCSYLRHKHKLSKLSRLSDFCDL